MSGPFIGRAQCVDSGNFSYKADECLLKTSDGFEFLFGDSPHLSLVLQVLAETLDLGYISRDLPDVNVERQVAGESAKAVLETYLDLYDLCSSVESEILVIWPRSSNPACDLFSEPAPPVPAAQQPEAPEVLEAVTVASYESFNIRLRLLEINETRGLDLGINWDGGVLETAGRLIAGVGQYQAGALPTADLDELVSFLETESIARRLDDVSVAAFPGEPVRFQSGGDVNVQLVGSGERNISKTFEFGLIVDVTPLRLSENVVRLDYSIQDVDPGNTSDPTLITRNSQNLSGAQPAECGQSIVIGQFVRGRGESQGSGVPGVSRVPVFGYGAGVGSTSSATRIYVLTLDLECRNVAAVAER
jgi:Flp pilus assembly secretin CpaC